MAYETMDKKSELCTVIEMMGEEVKGVEDYLAVHSSTEDPELKVAVAAIVADEKKHATALLNWVQRRMQSMYME